MSCCSPAHFKSIGQVAVTVEDSLQGVMSPPCEATEDWTKSLISLWHVHPRRHTISVAVGWLNPNTSFTPPNAAGKGSRSYLIMSAGEALTCNIWLNDLPKATKRLSSFITEVCPHASANLYIKNHSELCHVWTKIIIAQILKQNFVLYHDHVKKKKLPSCNLEGSLHNVTCLRAESRY